MIGNRATRSVVQTKLTVGPADDRYEREADRIADAVMRSPQRLDIGHRSTGAADRVRRDAAIGAAGGELDAGTESAISAARASGSPVAPRLRRDMESALGADLAGVRVHTGSTSDRLNATLQSRAFTVGPDIFVRRSDYAPRSEAGQRLLAHELVHVVQQGHGALRRQWNLDQPDVGNTTGQEPLAHELAQSIQQGAPRIRRSTVRPTVSPSDEVIRRMSVQNTQWSEAESITASTGGAGGVIFVENGGGKVIVKPGVEARAEELSSLVHAALEPEAPRGLARLKQPEWGIGALATRALSAEDIDALNERVDYTGDEKPVISRTGRLATLLDALEPDRSMVQQAGGGDTFGDQMADFAATGHFFGNEHIKTNEHSPLKPLFNDPGLAETLGKVVAADVLMGNADRIVDKANYENWVMDQTNKRVNLIDNIGDGYQNFAGGEAEFTKWTEWPFVAPLANRQFSDIIKTVWTSENEKFAGQMLTMKKMLGGGHVFREGEGRFQFVEQAERERLNDKLARETKSSVSSQRRSHLERIEKHMTIGLRQGFDQLIRLGPTPGFMASMPQDYRRNYAARIRALETYPADVAWQMAADDVEQADRRGE